MTGLHGANRLASNSLVEGLVFGRRAGDHAGRAEGPTPELPDLGKPPGADAPAGHLDVRDLINSVKSLMWRQVGIHRTKEGLETAVDEINRWRRYVNGATFRGTDGFELANLLVVASLVANAAAWRRESRGTHFRTDRPERDDEHYGLHSVQRLSGELLGREF
jgi:L-aspartate oxidase